MSNFLFVLGRDPDLSLIEIQSYFSTFRLPYKIVSRRKEFLVMDSNFNAFKLINHLGGTVKIAKQTNLEIDDLGFFESNKVYYSFTNYDDFGGEEILSSLKGKFKREKIKLIAVHPGRNILHGIEPSKFFKKNIFRKGFEIFKFNNKLYKTVAVSDTLGIEKRDIGRPCQEPLEAISIRLARILINLAGVKKNETILDPFMGIGTIMQEAMFMNINAIGLDKAKIKGLHAKKNLAWFKNKYKCTASFKCIEGDSSFLHNFVKENIDGVATEPYLGPLLKRLPTKEGAIKIIKELEGIYISVLKGVHKVLKKDRHVSIIIPRFKTNEGQIVKMNFLEIIKDLFSVVKFQGLSLPIVYDSGRSRILREIWVLKKK